MINASNLHVGGGVQVATSVIGELTLLPALPAGLVVWASDVVDANLRQLGYDLSALPAYEVVNSFGLKMLRSPLARRMQAFDAVLTVFGPLYVWRLTAANITGFAQAWIICPDNDAYRALGWRQSLQARLKFAVQAAFFRRADMLLVELDHVRDGLLRHGLASASSIRVVRNCLSSLYLSPQSWQPVAVDDTGCDIRLGFVGRNYPHKNTRIFPALIEILRREHGIRASVHVTFTNEEWAACDETFRAAVSNAGSLAVAQCPAFYRSMDAVIFPSLLECFSATPLEAMVMERPLFASDRPFNRDVCAEHAHYFDPLDPADAAAKIAAYLKGGNDRSTALHAASQHALSFSNASDRARQYLECLVASAQ
ncbi:glycosyltransferase [Pseudogulbenkiania subflava]|uniref:glycosyltransferase n=1 Tax=Pseudogulbenkiania subflava TaxID=451637 RepID=UPI0013566497|nr:glycosyltransferase [Pseudogulbenkiania subflava]